MKVDQYIIASEAVNLICMVWARDVHGMTNLAQVGTDSSKNIFPL